MEKNKVGSIINQDAVQTTFKKIQRLSKTLKPEEQVELSKHLANLPLTKDSAGRKATKAGKAGEYIQKEAADDRVQSTLDRPSISSALKRLENTIKSYTPEEQKELVQMLSKRFLTKSTSVQKAATAGRRGEFFEAADKKAKKAKKDTPEKDSEQPEMNNVDQLATKLTSHQLFRLLASNLSRENNAKKRAEIAYKLVKRLPRQTDKFLYFLRDMLK